MDRLLTQSMRRDANWYEEFAAEIAAEIDRTKRWYTACPCLGIPVWAPAQGSCMLDVLPLEIP